MKKSNKKNGSKNGKEEIVLFDRQHLQHTKKFQNELNSISSKFLQPFRYYDEVWVLGKHIGKKLSNTPKSYLQWCYDNMKLSDTAKSILKNYL